MIKIIYWILVLVTLFSCNPENKVLSGYVVHKQYVKSHMDNEAASEINFSIVVIRPPIVVHPRKPQFVDNAWYIYVANKDQVRKIEVNSSYWLKVKLGDKVKVTLK
jgi:hypothetical protein